MAGLVSMHIGIDTHFINSGQATGNHTYTAELVHALIDICPDNVFTLYAAGEHPYYQYFVGNPQVKVRQISSPNGLVRNFFSLPYAIAQEPPDVIHLQFYLPAFIQIPAVLTVPDLYYLHSSHLTSRQRILGQLMTWSLRRAKSVITVSEYSRQDISKTCAVDAAHITAIPHGVSSRFHPANDPTQIHAMKQKIGVSGEYILFIGRTDDPRKNLLTLIEAYAALKSRNELNQQLVIVGRHGTGTKTVVNRIRALGLERDVLLPGVIDDVDLPILISGASWFVYVSSFEGFGLPVLEAMACGTPVITSNATSLPEVVGDAALMVPPADVNELMNAMRQLRDASLRRQLRERGLARASLFSWDRAAQETLAVYEKAIQQAKSALRKRNF